jgi:hypothetical protein
MAIVVHLKRKPIVQPNKPNKEEKSVEREAREGVQLIQAFQKIRSPNDRKALIAYAKKLAKKKR